MRLLSFILGVSLVLAVLKAVLQVILLLILVMLLWFGITRPRETLGCVLTFIAFGLASRYPIMALATFAVLALAGMHSQGNA